MMGVCVITMAPSSVTVPSSPAAAAAVTGWERGPRCQARGLLTVQAPGSGHT